MADERRMPAEELDAVRLAHAAEPFIGEVVEAQLAQALRRRLLRVSVAYLGVLAVAVGVIVYFGSQGQSATRRIERRDHDEIRAAELATCARVQVLRSREDTFRGTVYGFVRAAEMARAASYRATRDPSDRLAAEAYGDIAASIFYLPATDCRRAVDHARTYRAPRSIPYGEALRLRLVRPPAGLPGG